MSACKVPDPTFKFPFARGFDESEGLRLASRLPIGPKLLFCEMSGNNRLGSRTGEVEADLE